jgi:hypothetical protein
MAPEDSSNEKNEMTFAEWEQLLKSCNDATSHVVLFGEDFVSQWTDRTVVFNDDDRSAAAKLHIQLVSRITTQRLSYVDGEEVAALTSIYRLFGQARDVFTEHPKSSVTDGVVWHVMNTHVRPFTAKWHRASERGALAALDATDIFRHELAMLQKYLVRFDALLVAIRDGTKLTIVEPGGTGREAAIEAEMAEKLSWRIDERLGGIDATRANDINTAEREAVLARRMHYAGRRDLIASEAEAGKWMERPHATALAISGGGIRSATFALGVLAALARRNLLYQFDYLSTVSGGGYLGAFLTTFLSAPDLPADSPKIGLGREDLPFLREDGEAAALRHVRHHSKYLATGRLWERLQMAGAQVYGLAMNGLAFAWVALVAALAEYFIRSLLPGASFWKLLTVLSGMVVALIALLIPLLRRLPALRARTDAIFAWSLVVLLVLLGWQALYCAHDGLAHHRTHEAWLILLAAIPLVASAALALAGNLVAPVRLILLAIAAVAAPLLFLGFELAAYDWIGRSALTALAAIAVAATGYFLFWRLFDINFTAPHRFYKRKLGEAYLVQPDAANLAEPLHENVSLKLTDCNAHGRAPYHLVNCALNVPASENSRMQGRLTDFFLFSPRFCGSPLTGYRATGEWQDCNPDLDLATAMAISGAAAAPQMGLGTIKNLSFWLALFNIRLGYWLANPFKSPKLRKKPPGLSYLLQEMFGWANENRAYINVSDGGHIENLGVYELLRRRCKYIVAIDGEQDQTMTFHGLTTLLRLAYIDLGITVDVGLDALRLAEGGLSHSHFALCRIRYPQDERGGAESYGYLLYLKLSLTGNEGEFLRRYKLDEPAFPHTSTANQFFSEAQFEAYRSLGEHVGDKMFLPAIVGETMARGDASVALETWFGEIGKNMLEPLPDKDSQPPS